MKNCILYLLIFGFSSCHSLINTGELCISSHCDRSTINISYSNGKEMLDIPIEYLNVVRIKRDNTELREGPRFSFKIASFLSLNTPAILMRSSGAWSKIYLPIEMQSGWVHTQTLQRTRSHLPDSISLPKRKLPAIFVLNIHHKLYAKDFKPIFGWKLTKGDKLYSIKEDSNFRLVWVPAKKKAIWIDNSFIN